jgi:hypothetical protein
LELATTIAKRTFLATLPCATRGWFSARVPQEPLTPADEWSFFGGNQLGAAAREQLGAGLLLPRTPPSLARETTQRMMAQPATTLLFEASFQWGNFVARADAVRRAAAGWDVIETKSGKEPKEGKEVDAEYIDDLAYTVMVARGAGLVIARCSLLLLSRAYRLGAPGKLLVEIDVTDAVLSRAAEFAALAPVVEAAVRAATRPDPALKLGCRSCDYFASSCLGAGIEQTIFMLPALSEKRLNQIKPIVDLRQVPDSVDLTDNQRRVFDVMRSGKAQLLDGLDDLDQVTWPAYYLDFETVSPVLPWFTGDASRDQHTFQYSIHVCDAVRQVVSHHEYLAGSTGDWRRALVEQLLADLGDRGSVIVFTNFEEKRLEEMAILFPELAPRLAAVIARLFDLNDVIKRGYCHPGFNGSTSIKKVLPVMVPELGYAGMAIGEGQSASGAFGLMRVGEYAPDTFDDWRRDLLAYCKLDTLAMVRVHAALCQVRAAPASS